MHLPVPISGPIAGLRGPTPLRRADARRERLVRVTDGLRPVVDVPTHGPVPTRHEVAWVKARKADAVPDAVAAPRPPPYGITKGPRLRPLGPEGALAPAEVPAGPKPFIAPRIASAAPSVARPREADPAVDGA